MQVKKMCGTIAARALVIMLSVALVFTMMPLSGGMQAHATDELTVESPALVVTGTGLIGNSGVYDADNVSMEKSYTMDELKSFTESQGKVTKQKYSAMKSQSPYAKNYYLVDGVKVSSLLGKEESAITDDVSVIATDNYATEFLQDQTYTNGQTVTVGLNKARYFYDFTTGEKGEQVPAVIGWADVNTGLSDGSAPAALPEGDTADLGFLRLYCGQYDGEGGGAEDMNQPLWNGKSSAKQVNKIQEGDAISEVVLTVGNKEYTRADILLMDFAERSYTYSTSKGDKTDSVRGVPFKVLLAGEADDSVVSFTAADGYDMSDSTMTVRELVDGNYMLAYEANGSGIYKTGKDDSTKYGFLTLYGDGAKPASMINSVTVEAAGGGDEPATEPVGDATAETADLTITGDALAGDGYFTIKGIKNWEGISKVDATFHTMNSSGTEADVTVQGATLENIVNVVGLAEGAEIESVDIFSSDGKTTTYSYEKAFKEDLQGNKAMFIWTEGTEKVTKVCRGQMSADDANKSDWAKDVTKIVFNKKTETATDEEIRDGYVQKAEEVLEGIDYSAYGADNAVALWISASKLEIKLTKVETAAEAEAILKEIEDLIATTPTAAQEMETALNDYPIEATAASASTAIKLSWNKIPKADAYVVLKSTSADGTFSKVKMVTETSYTDSKVQVEKAYVYKIVPCTKVKGEFVYGNESTAFTGKLKLAKPSIKSLKRGKKKATIKWGKVYGAKGYVIYRSTKKSSGFKAVKTIKSGSTVKYVNKKLKAKKKYYYKVRAYVKVDGKTVYGPYSTVKSVKRYR